MAPSAAAPSGTAHGASTGIDPLYDKKSILAFSSGKPSEAYGAPYRVFDEGKRRIARLPRPPYQFLDRISVVEGEPFVMEAGASAIAHFDVNPNHWYFGANRQREMPFAILLEVALQPCGWLAAYVGSALTSEGNLRRQTVGAHHGRKGYDHHAGRFNERVGVGRHDHPALLIGPRKRTSRTPL